MVEKKDTGRRSSFVRITAIVMAFWIGSVAVMEILLSTPMVTNVVNKVASRYIDGDISFGKVSASILKRFPSVTLTLEDFCITYPSDRFDISEQDGPQGALLFKGCGELADTLATFSRFSAGVRVTPLIFGQLKLPRVILEHPKIYAHAYSDGKVNWDIFISKDKTAEKDTVKTALPQISVGKILLSDYSQIVFTDSREAIFALVELKHAGFDGKLSTGKSSRNRIGLSVDSLFVAGRIASDTLAVGLDRLRIHEHDDHMDVEMQAKTHIATEAFGRLDIPIDLGGTVHFPKDSVFAVGIHNFRAEIAAIPMEGEADLKFHQGRTEMDARLSVSECKVDDVINKFVRNFIPEVSMIKTDAIIGIDATCKGEYIPQTGKLPIFCIDVVMPRSTISHTGMNETAIVAFDGFVANTREGKMNLNINEIEVSTEGLELSAFGAMSDILSDDPSLSVDGTFSASLDTLIRFLPDSLDITAEGSMDVQLSGQAKLSDLSIYTFSRSSLTGKATSERIAVRMPDDSLDINIEGLEIGLSPETVRSKMDTTQSFRLMGISGRIGNVEAAYKGGLALKGKGISISAKNSTSGTDTSQVSRLGGRFSADTLGFTDAAGTRISLRETQNGFQMMPQKDNPSVPVLTLTSTNRRISLSTGTHRAVLADASISADAAMTTVELRQRTRRQTRELPEWQQEEDFRKQDIDIRLDQGLAKYFREWNMHGDLNVRSGILMTPYFPLRNMLQGMQICFTNDRIEIDTLKIRSGRSSIEAKGELTGLRRALAGGRRGGTSRSALNLDMDIHTDGMDANELLTALSTGSHFDEESVSEKMAEVSDEEFLDIVVSDTVSATEKMKLFVIPGNLNADIKVSGKDITYSDLNISRLDANLLMRERCVQITNTMATSNIGNVSFEGFYATRSKQDIKTGFNFDFKDITAEKAIDLMPAVDTLMPLLKSFAGNIDCEIAATASLDTNMNILTPTINGVLRISGDDLSVTDSDMFTSLAKKLKFDNNKTGRIKHMTVEGVIKDNVLEVFPFVLNLDRYTLALSGKQNLDMSYRYHASLIRSPMLIKVGVDVYGQDFDNMKFKIGRPKYKNENVPVFTAVIDETKINLAKSIHDIFEKGVEAAIQENERQEALHEHLHEIGYVNAVDQETEELSEEEQKQLEETTENPENNE